MMQKSRHFLSGTTASSFTQKILLQQSQCMLRQTPFQTQLRFRSRNNRKTKDKRQPFLPTDNTRLYESQVKLRPRKRHTPQRDILFLQDTSVAFEGEIMRNAPKRMIQKFLRPNVKGAKVRATYITNENKHIYQEKYKGLNQGDILNKRMLKNFKRTLENMIIPFKRQIPTRLKIPQFIVPITKDDICNRVWNLKRIVLEPENLKIDRGAHEQIKRPGYWKCWYTCPDGDVVKLRVYCPKGGRRSSIAGNSWDGFPYRT